MEFVIKRKSDDELKHYGIPGQVHGIRNYQYENGTLTPAGKERYAKMRQDRSSGGNQQGNGPAGMRSRQINVASDKVAEVKKTEAVGGSGKNADKPWFILPGIISMALGTKDTTNDDVIPSEREYEAMKREFEDDDWVQAYDLDNNSYLHVKRDEMRDYVNKLKEQGIGAEIPTVTKPDAKPEEKAEIKRMNAQIRYWNEMVQDASKGREVPLMTQEMTPRPKRLMKQTIDANKESYRDLSDKAKKSLKQAAKKVRNGKPITSSPVGTATHGDESDELMHYGVLGMKWGVRRYQKEDGSLTKEGKAHYANNAAYELGKKATVTGYAAQIAQKRADKQNVKLEKAKAKGKQNAIDKAQAKADVANKVSKELWEEYDGYVKQGEEHIAKLIEEFGEENVQGFNYRENKSKSLTGPDKLVNERTMNGMDIAVAAGKTIAANIVMRMAGIPAVAIYTPPSGSQLGRQLANERRSEARREQKREQQAKVDAQSATQKQQVKSDHPYYTKQERSEAKIRANEKDEWNLNFLEAVQNKTYANGTARDPQKKKRMMQEYDAFLRDPVNYRPPEGDEE